MQHPFGVRVTLPPNTEVLIKIKSEITKIMSNCTHFFPTPVGASFIIHFSMFFRLADYLIVNTMHVLAVNSVSTLLNYLTEQLQQTPTVEAIQNFSQVSEYHEKLRVTRSCYTCYAVSLYNIANPNTET